MAAEENVAVVAAVAEEVEVEAAAEAAAERGQALRARARRRSRGDEASTSPRCSAERQGWPGVRLGRQAWPGIGLGARQAWPGVGLGQAGVAWVRVRVRLGPRTSPSPSPDPKPNLARQPRARSSARVHRTTSRAPLAATGHTGRARRSPDRRRWPGRSATQRAAGRRTPAARGAQAAAAAPCRRRAWRRRGSPCTDARCCLAARSSRTVLPDGRAPKRGRARSQPAAAAAAVAAGVSASVDLSLAALRAHRRPSGRRHVSALCPQPTHRRRLRGGSGPPTARRWRSVAPGCTQSSTRQPSGCSA